MKLKYRTLSTAKIIFFFGAITFIAYFPFTSMLFALKNDAFTGYFPPKFFMSESLHSGYLPLWNSYINYGIPQYGDMSSGFWNPITWLIASTVGYNAYTFTVEEALYIFTAGIGMYYLTGYWRLTKNTRLIAGVAYMCCGYFVGHLQHFNWITGAAFLPWCFAFYLKALNKLTPSIFLKTGISFLFLVSSAHPGIIIGAMYFFLFITIAFYFHNIQTSTNKYLTIKKLFTFQFLILLSIILFSIGPIIGYLEVLPYIGRGEKISLAESLAEPTTLQSWISLILPFSITKIESFYITDISMRNCYFGLLFLWMLLYGIISQKSNWQKLFLTVASAFFLLSLGGIFKEIAYRYIPFIGYVRLNGEFRIFAIFSLILFAAIEFDKIKNVSVDNKFKGIYYLLFITFLSLFTYAIVKIFSSHESVFFKSIYPNEEIRMTLKKLINTITVYDTLLFQSVIQLLFLTLIYYGIRKRRDLFLISIISIEIVMATLINIPYTGVGKASVNEIQALLDKSPKGIPTPVLQSTNENDYIPGNEVKMIGDWSFYSKQIGTAHAVPYPINLKSTLVFFKSKEVPTINKKAFIYLTASNQNDTIIINAFSPNKLDLSIKNIQSQFLVVKQNFYPFWECKINNINSPVLVESQTFMKIPLEAGKNHIEIVFRNKKITSLIFLHLSLLVSTLLTLAIHSMSNTQTKSAK